MWNSYWSSVELIALSGHILAMVYPCAVGVEIRIHSYYVITMGGNVGGVWSMGKDHCASISLSCLVYVAIMDDSGFMRA